MSRTVPTHIDGGINIGKILSTTTILHHPSALVLAESYPKAKKSKTEPMNLHENNCGEESLER
jgi:hypothetical protein